MNHKGTEVVKNKFGTNFRSQFKNCFFKFFTFMVLGIAYFKVSLLMYTVSKSRGRYELKMIQDVCSCQPYRN